MRKDLEKQFEAESKSLSSLRERFVAEVRRWIYSTSEIWSYLDLRLRGSDSSILSGPEGAYFACGHDHADRPILLRRFDSSNACSAGEPALVEEFISYEGDRLDVARFERGNLEAVYRLTFRDRLLIDEEVLRKGFHQHSRFQYEGRRKRLQQSVAANGQVFFEIAFGPHGEQTFFRVRRDGTRFELGQPLPKGTTTKSLKETIRNRLIALIPQVVVNSGIAEPIYCVALAYDGEGNDALPTVLGIGLESERERWIVEHGKKARDWIWNPAEFQHYEKPHTQLEDKALDEACDYLNSKLAESSSGSPAIKLLVDTATALNQANWPASIQRTPDFVVYAVDFELASLKKNLKGSLKPEQLSALKSKGLL